MTDFYLSLKMTDLINIESENEIYPDLKLNKIEMYPSDKKVIYKITMT